MSEKQIKAGSFEFKVNGVSIESPKEVLTAYEILKLAQEKGAIPGDAADYILKGDKGEYQPDQPIDLKEDSVFLTLPNKPTPVA